MAGLHMLRGEGQFIVYTPGQICFSLELFVLHLKDKFFGEPQDTYAGKIELTIRDWPRLLRFVNEAFLLKTIVVFLVSHPQPRQVWYRLIDVSDQEGHVCRRHRQICRNVLVIEISMKNDSTPKE